MTNTCKIKAQFLDKEGTYEGDGMRLKLELEMNKNTALPGVISSVQ